MPSTLVWC